MLNSKGFDLWSKDYDKTVQLSEESNEYPFAGYKEVLNTVYSEIKAGGGKKILDIGFGTGILAKRLYDEGAEIYGVDFSVEMVNAARKKCPMPAFIILILRRDFQRIWKIQNLTL